MLVWVDAWQMQCCGRPFAVGGGVAWMLYEESDRDWLTSVLGAELAVEVTHGEDHHGDLPEDAPVTTGRVERIRAVSSRFGSDPSKPSGNVLIPIPGSAVVTDVATADGWYPERGDLHFNGYLST